MVETKYFGMFTEGELVTIVMTGLLRKKTYIVGEVMGVRHSHGKEYLIIKPTNSDLIDISLSNVDHIKKGGDSTPQETQESPKVKYNRV